MRLKGKSALVEFAREFLTGLDAFRLVVFEDSFAIDVDGHAVALNDDVLCPPFVVLRGSRSDACQTVKTASLDPIGVSDIYLALETVPGPATLLIFRVEVNTAVRAGRSHYFDFQFEILERFFVAHIE